MKEAIRQRARELGFDDCHFTSAAAPTSAAHFQSWLTLQHHGEMTWIERNAEKRKDPQKVLPGARSVICLAASYMAGDDGQMTSKEASQSSFSRHPTGLIARYARSPDYHNLLAGPLKQLNDYANHLGGPGTRSLWYLDTGPVLERDFAQRAGLGFVGKHTNVISRKLGNWILLAEILTTMELEPDAPEKNHCGSCTRCLAACPTSAIISPFQLDARKCISYLTIELKGSIPMEFRRAIGNRIYGCDDCLAACPWNRFARQGSLMHPHLRADLAQPDLLELLRLDDAGFKARFAGTPMLRTKRRGVLRNVCVALGNVGDETALPELEKASLDQEPLIAEHARWAMMEITRRKAKANQ